MASVLAKTGQTAALALRMREHFHIDLPQGPRRTRSGVLAIAGTGPGAWLATFEHGDDSFAAQLRDTVGDLASVSDQSDGYAVLRLSGFKVRETLGKLAMIDLHPRAFQIDDVAVTVAAHIGVTLWRSEDRADGAPVFEIAAFRSLAASLWHALSTSAAEFGYVVEAPAVHTPLMRHAPCRRSPPG
jgi:sarcosine oxidase subunit gamma